MSASTVFLGDELSAAGYRLAGVDTRVPPPGEEAAFLETALKEARLVLIGLGCARAIAPAVLEPALALRLPLVMVVPDWDGTRLAEEPAIKVRRVLGLEA
jgi:vacuolar-type H+-ATPase subunit F/Vma7